MIKHNIDILFLQETHISDQTQENRKRHTWYFSPAEKEDHNNTWTGVACVIRNELINYVLDIEPINGRIMSLTLNAAIPITFINVYAPPATSNIDKKTDFYKTLETYTTDKGKQSIIVTSGDFNARIGRCAGPHEEHIVGQHTLEPETAKLGEMTRECEENRSLMLQHMQKTKQVIVNTLFPKPEANKITYRQKKDEQWGPPYGRPKYEQIDYITIPNRWKNGIIDVTADPNANISTDHIPLIAICNFKLKQLNKQQSNRPLKLEPASREEFRNYNNRINREMRQHRGRDTNIVKLMREAAKENIENTIGKPRKEPISVETLYLIKHREKTNHERRMGTITGGN